MWEMFEEQGVFWVSKPGRPLMAWIRNTDDECLIRNIIPRLTWRLKGSRKNMVLNCADFSASNILFLSDQFGYIHLVDEQPLSLGICFSARFWSMKSARTQLKDFEICSSYLTSRIPSFRRFDESTSNLITDDWRFIKSSFTFCTRFQFQGICGQWVSTRNALDLSQVKAWKMA